jgi:hypothetical protein
VQNEPNFEVSSFQFEVSRGRSDRTCAGPSDFKLQTSNFTLAHGQLRRTNPIGSAAQRRQVPCGAGVTENLTGDGAEKTNPIRAGASGLGIRNEIDRRPVCHYEPGAAFGRNQRVSRTKPQSSRRRALQRSSSAFVALWLRVKTKYLSCKDLHRAMICARRFQQVVVQPSKVSRAVPEMRWRRSRAAGRQRSCIQR